MDTKEQSPPDTRPQSQRFSFFFPTESDSQIISWIKKENHFFQFIKNRYLSKFEMLFSVIFETIDFSSLKKFHILDKTMNNIFINYSQRVQIEDIFSNVQKIVHAIYRLKNAWRFKRSRTYNTDDLLMNTIDKDDKNTFVVLQNNTKYVFLIRELLQMTQSALSNCCHFFPEPLDCKNPYTNIPFDKSSLYNIYFTARQSHLRIPPLFESFFRANFNYTTFLTDNEEVINDEYLQTYVENNCIGNLLEHVKDMFKEHGLRCNIHKTFPVQRLIPILKPYLTLYFISHFSLNHHKKSRAQHNLKRRLYKFVEYNPLFGKRKVKLVSNPFTHVKKCIHDFNDRHLPFTHVVENFMTSHLEREEEHIQSAPMSRPRFYHSNDTDTEDDEYDSEEDREDSEDRDTPVIAGEEEGEDEGERVGYTGILYPDTSTEEEAEFILELIEREEQEEQEDVE